MPHEIKTLTFGGVNCYLVITETGFILVDTGLSKHRRDIEQELENEGCMHGTLKLIVLTHGDFDHTGNCAYLREKYKTKTALHVDDRGIVERGDLFYNRNPNPLTKLLGKAFLFFMRAGLKEDERFTPDLTLEDGCDLSAFGFDAQVIYLPGHSKGSIGILTSAGDLFCGDLLENTKEPAKNSIISDKKAFAASVAKLKDLDIGMVYPGHGMPFPMEQLISKLT